MANHIKYNEKTFSVGDTIQVFQKIKEAGKSRTQLFEGILIAVKGHEMGKSICVRKIAAAAVGVERIWPINSPMIKNIKLKKRGKVRRAKLYYMRSRKGKLATKVKEIVKKTAPKNKTIIKKAKKRSNDKR